MTVYKPVREEAGTAAELAVALARGDRPPAGIVNGATDNGQETIASVLIEPLAVTRANLAETVFADDFVSIRDVCSGELGRACARARIG
jgi:D-xylose transport system substrate-binding protein